MRSLAFKAALAALLLSAPIGSALAKAHHAGVDAFPNVSSPSGGDRPDSPPPSVGYAPGGQLRAILDDLQNDDARIVSDRRAKLITPSEVRSLRGEEAMIRRTAARDSAADGGKIPTGEYDQLMAQVMGLGSQIDQDAGQQ